MQIVIDIPEEMHKAIELGANGFSNYLHVATRIGTPLPKGHGRLIDAGELFDKIQFADFSSSDDVNTALFSISDAPTIIEADKESEDKE